jgi:putative molybdopterin biosynthesis protein
MSVYLHDIPLPEAQARLEEALKAAGRWGLLGIEDIPLDERAVGRVLAEPVWAKISSPHYHAAAMDGFAVRADDTAGAMPNNPVDLPCEAEMDGRKATYVDTGDPMPVWSDAVIPIENVEPLSAHPERTSVDRPAMDLRRPSAIRIRASVTPWSHVRTMGEDMVATQLVLPAGQILRPVDLGAMAACGHSTVRVARRPRVAILPTGSELVSIGKEVKTGDIIEFNSLVLASQVNTWGGQATRFPITPDEFDSIRLRVAEASVDHDLILLNAGSSAGSEDFSARVVESLGELLVHGVAVRPGHPVILGMVKQPAANSFQPPADHQPNHLSSITNHQSAIFNLQSTIPIIGVPGYPVSAALTGEIFVAPLLARWLGREPDAPITVTATLTHKVTSPPGDDDYMRVAVGRIGERLLAAPLSRGSGVITSLVRADGIVVLQRGSQGLAAGEQVSVRLYRSPNDLERTIFAIGSHDMTLDILAQFLSIRQRRLVSANVGSQGGLIALRRGEAHLAGSHLLDPETGTYNLPHIRQYASGVPIKVVALVERQQGLMVLRGNPKCIRTLQDLSREDVTFINRQRGAGTRVLLDYHLSLLGVAPEGIRGYNQEEYTHLAIAAAISSGRADCGLGIAAAAQALGLDFLPLFQEHYELVIPARFFDEVLLTPLFEVLNDPTFKQTVSALPGYDISRMGTLVAEVN